MSDQSATTPPANTPPISEQILESMPFPMSVYRRDGLVVMVNTGVERLFKAPRSQTVNTYNVYEDPSTAENGFRTAFNRALAGETATMPPAYFDPQPLGLPGQPLWFTTTFFPFLQADGTIDYLGGSHQDVTAQMQAESAQTQLTGQLRESQAYTEALLNAIPDLLFVIDRDGTFLDVRTGPGGALALPPEVFMGRRMAEVLPPELVEQMNQAVSTATRTGEPQTIVYDIPVNDELRNYEGRVATLGSDKMLMITRDVTDRQRAAADRLELQEQMIEAQRASLRELSSPLIPLADNIVVMPLVGTIDSARAQLIMEVLLEGIAAHQAEVVLLDISGVRVVDTQVANALLRAAQAVKLLGAQVVLTGISAEVAQTIVHLGADMHSIITQANLQAGLRYAMERYAAEPGQRLPGLGG